MSNYKNNQKRIRKNFLFNDELQKIYECSYLIWKFEGVIIMHSTDEFWKMLFNTLPTGDLLIGFSTSTFIGRKPIESFVFFISTNDVSATEWDIASVDSA